jgi:hypothetical protein
MDENTISQNPGSYLHSSNSCRPCNKFIFGKINSCKYDNKCLYCHIPTHERPKHRGQRGRHVNQKKQFIEQQYTYPSWLREIINIIYNEIQDECKKLKIILYTIENIEERINKVKFIANKIKNIGHIAQSKRPENKQFNNNDFEIPIRMTVADLDNKYKWLQGTIHLMVRKIWEANPNESKKQEIELQVYDLINMVKILIKYIIEYPKVQSIDSINYEKELYEHYLLMYTTIFNKVPIEALEWILPKLQLISTHFCKYEDIITIEKIFFRFPLSVYDDEKFKNIINNDSILTLSDLIQPLEDYFELIIDDFFESIEQKFN